MASQDTGKQRKAPSDGSRMGNTRNTSKTRKAAGAADRKDTERTNASYVSPKKTPPCQLHHGKRLVRLQENGNNRRNQNCLGPAQPNNKKSRPSTPWK